MSEKMLLIVFSLLVSTVYCGAQETQGELTCGGPNGDQVWSDETYATNWGHITQFEVWHGMVIDGLRFTYGSQPTPVRGSDDNESEYFSYVLGPGEEIIGARMSVGREGLGFDDVLCKLKLYIRRPDGQVFSYLFGDCDKDEQECGEYIPNKRLMYTAGRYTDGRYVDYLELQFDDAPTQ